LRSPSNLLLAEERVNHPSSLSERKRYNIDEAGIKTKMRDIYIDHINEGYKGSRHE